MAAGRFDPRHAERVKRSHPRLGRGLGYLGLFVACTVAAVAMIRYYVTHFHWGVAARAEPPVEASRAPVRVVSDAPAREAPAGPPAAAAPPTPPPAAPRGPRDAGPPKNRTIAFQVDYKPRENPDFVDGRVRNPAPGCSLFPGQNIPAVLADVVISEVQAPVTAVVSSPVLARDAPDPLRPLLPQGTTLVGRYSVTDMKPGRRRLDMVWDYAERPDGSVVRLDQASGLDFAGSGGVGGKVESHWGQVFLATAVLSLIGAAEYGTSSVAAAGGDIGDAITAAAGREGARTGRRIVDQYLSLGPTISIRGGTPITVRPRKLVRAC